MKFFSIVTLLIFSLACSDLIEEAGIIHSTKLTNSTDGLDCSKYAKDIKIKNGSYQTQNGLAEVKVEDDQVHIVLKEGVSFQANGKSLYVKVIEASLKVIAD